MPRPAGPGEFSKQAFNNDRLDLTQVEALGDLINAQTEGQKVMALRSMGGKAAEVYDRCAGCTGRPCRLRGC